MSLDNISNTNTNTILSSPRSTLSVSSSTSLSVSTPPPISSPSLSSISTPPPSLITSSPITPLLSNLTSSPLTKSILSPSSSSILSSSSSLLSNTLSKDSLPHCYIRRDNFLILKSSTNFASFFNKTIDNLLNCCLLKLLTNDNEDIISYGNHITRFVKNEDEFNSYNTLYPYAVPSKSHKFITLPIKNFPLNNSNSTIDTGSLTSSNATTNGSTLSPSNSLSSSLTYNTKSSFSSIPIDSLSSSLSQDDNKEKEFEKDKEKDSQYQVNISFSDIYINNTKTLFVILESKKCLGDFLSDSYDLYESSPRPCISLTSTLTNSSPGSFSATSPTNYVSSSVLNITPNISSNASLLPPINKNNDLRGPNDNICSTPQSRRSSSTNPSTPSLNSCRGLNILVVDDNPIVLKLLNKKLRFLGHNVSVANGGMVALDLTRDNTFDLVIIDINMPEMTGLQLSHKLREIESKSRGSIPSSIQNSPSITHNTIFNSNSSSSLLINSQPLTSSNSTPTMPLSITSTPISSKKSFQKIIAMSEDISNTLFHQVTNAGFDIFVPKPISDERLKHILDWASK